MDCFNSVVNDVSLVSAACSAVPSTGAAPAVPPHPSGHHGLSRVPSLRAATSAQWASMIDEILQASVRFIHGGACSIHSLLGAVARLPTVLSILIWLWWYWWRNNTRNKSCKKICWLFVFSYCHGARRRQMIFLVPAHGTAFILSLSPSVNSRLGDSMSLLNE